MLPAHLHEINAARDARRAMVVVSDLNSGETRLLRAEELSDPVSASAVESALRTGKAGLAEIGGRSVFINVHLPPPRIVAIGAGHIAQALAGMAAIAGFRHGDHRPARLHDLTRNIRHGCTFCQNSPKTCSSGGLLMPSRRWPRSRMIRPLDDLPLTKALAAQCFYVGALGGRKSHAKRIERLAGLGVDDAAIARIHGPIGLDIRAANPAEIAVSILADIILSLRTRNVSATAI